MVRKREERRFSSMRRRIVREIGEAKRKLLTIRESKNGNLKNL